MHKIAILSDIHGNLAALEQVVADLEARGVARVFNLGDHLSGPLWPAETARFLMGRDWIHIAGNHDRGMCTHGPEELGLSDAFARRFLDEAALDWLRTLPPVLETDDEFLLCHGTPSDDSTYLLETVEHERARLATPAEIVSRLGRTAGSRMLLCGHSHMPRVVELSDGRTILNPGSVGLPAYRDDSPPAHVIENGSPLARYAILEYRQDRWQAELVTVPYDHLEAAERARRNGRPDWEIGLRTGFMQPAN
jgi:predicted phosphodiesterase